jgi:hypothetical protein
MSNAAEASLCVTIAVAVMMVATILTRGYALVVFVPFYLMGLLVAGAQTLASRIEKRSGPGGSRCGRRRRRRDVAQVAVDQPGAGAQANQSRRAHPAFRSGLGVREREIEHQHSSCSTYT